MFVGEPFRPMVSSSIQRIILQSVEVKYGHRLAVCLENTAYAHVARGVQFLDCSNQARSLRLDGHVAIFQHSLYRYIAAFYLDVAA